MEKLPKYADLIAQSAEEKEQEVNEMAIEEGKLSLDADILATKKELQAATRRLANAMGAVPFNSQMIVSAQVEVDSLNEGLERLEKLKEMF